VEGIISLSLSSYSPSLLLLLPDFVEVNIVLEIAGPGALAVEVLIKPAIKVLGVPAQG
jgi:hypothetical protein